MKWTRGTFNALVACVTTTELADVIAFGKLSFEDFQKQQSLIDPYSTYCKNLRNCIKDIVQAAGNEPRQRRLKKETIIWDDPDKLFNSLGEKMGKAVEIHYNQSNKNVDKETNINVCNSWKIVLKDKATKKLLSYLNKNGHIRNIGEFKKFINMEQYYSEFLATKHYAGNDGKLKHDHGETIVKLHNKCVIYPYFREEVVRFISCMGYIWECKWIDKHTNEPNSVIESWEWPSLEQDENNNTPSYKSSRSALEDSLNERTDSGTWTTFVDKQNRVEDLITDIHGNRITKIWGLGGLGKTALVIACLKKLVNQNDWMEHEYWRFTVKSKEQGEFTEEGISQAMDFSILQWGQSIENIVTTLARRSENYEEGLKNKELVKLSTEYLADNPCIVVIDNAEDIEEFSEQHNNDYGLFEDFVKNFARLPDNSKSKLIITSRNRMDYPGVNTVKAKYLNSDEMEEMAKHRNHYLIREMGEESRNWRDLKKNEQEDWNAIGDWSRSKLGGREKDAIGHPHFIILLVYEWTFSEEKLPFSEQLMKMIESDKISNLEEYITSKSIDMLKPALQKYCFELAAKYTEGFSHNDISSILPKDSLGLEEGIIEHLSQDLGLIKEIYREKQYDMPLSYEWIEYARKELAKKYTGSRKSIRNVVPTDSHKVDDLYNELSTPDNSNINITSVIEKGKAYIEAGSEIQKERVIYKSIMTVHRLQEAQKRRDFFIPESQRDELREVANKTAIKTVKGIMNYLSKQMKKEPLTLLPNDCEGYVIHISNANWKNHAAAFDLHIKFIISNFGFFSRKSIVSILEDIIIKRWAINDGDFNSIVELGLMFQTQLRISTQNIILAAIVDGSNISISDDLRKFVSVYFSNNKEKYTMEIIRSRHRPKERHKKLLEMLREPLYSELLKFADLEKHISNPKYISSTFNVKMPPLNKGLLHCTVEKDDIRIILRNPPHAFKENGTTTNQVITVQHLYSKEFEDFTVISLQFINIDQDWTDKINSDSIKEKETYNVPPDLIDNIIKEVKEEEEKDYPTRYKKILDEILTCSFQASGPLGELVNNECLKEFDMSSRAIRRGFGSKHKIFTKSLREIYGKQIIIVNKGSSAIVKLRPNSRSGR